MIDVFCPRCRAVSARAERGCGAQVSPTVDDAARRRGQFVLVTDVFCPRVRSAHARRVGRRVARSGAAAGAGGRGALFDGDAEGIEGGSGA